MNFPRMTPLSHPLMTSKPRFLDDGTGEVCLECYFSQLSGTSSARLGQLTTYLELQASHCGPNLNNLR